MKVSFEIIVFNSDYVLEECIRTLMPYGPIFVAEGPVQFWANQGFQTSTDRTNEILHDLLPESHIIHGQWDEKDSESNAVIHLIPDDTDFLWLVDSDELFRDEDIQKILKMLETNEWDSISFKANSFYGGFERRMTGFEENFEVHRIQRFYKGARWQTHRPPTILAPDGKPWREHRHLNHQETDKLGLRFFHYSYLWPLQMRGKASYYHNMNPSGTIPDYMNQIYIPWVTGDDAKKREVELKYRGVHDWRPEVRGDCYTVPFEGEHPFWIRKNLDRLQRRFDKELERVRKETIERLTQGRIPSLDFL